MDFTEVYGDSVGGVSAAARSGSLVRVRTLIRAGLSLDVKDNRGWTCLHEGAAQGHKGCVREILRAAAAASPTLDFRSFVNAQTHEGETALFLAARSGHVSVIKLLLKARADIDLQTNDLSCPLYAAVDGGHTEVVTLLMLQGAQLDRSHTASCWTCLHQAVYKGHSEIVGLLSCGPLELVDDYGITPLFLAAQYGQFSCLQKLTTAGANVDFQAADGATPLLIASQEGHEDCVAELLFRRADANLPCSDDWPQLPVHAAAQFGHVGVLKRLLQFTDRSIGHAPGQVSPVYLAVLRDQRGALQLLLREGFSPDAQDCEDLLGLRSPLTQALDLALSDASRGLDTVRILLSAGATVLRETWAHVLKSDRADVLQLVLDFRTVPGLAPQSPVLDFRTVPGPAPQSRVLDFRTFPGPAPQSPGSAGPGLGSRRDLTEQEMKDLLEECGSQTQTSLTWTPLLLTAGLEPHALLQETCSEAPGEVLNLLLQHLNWSCLSPDQRLILDQRRTSGTWDPLPVFDCVPSLFHLCRLRLRQILGSAAVMRTSVLHQLPVPALFHHFLQFRDVH